MYSTTAFSLALAALFTPAFGAPTTANLDVNPTVHSIAKRGFSCDNLVTGLRRDDCEHMSNIGMAGQGFNDLSSNGKIWLGNQGPNTFTFTNDATYPSPVPVTIIVWYNAPYDYESSFMDVRRPMISYSLPHIGDKVTISLENGVSGGWAALNNHDTHLSRYGQIYNTWGEFTTGDYATADVSREVNMSGNVMSLRVSGGCRSDMNTCVFKCKQGNECGEPYTYDLVTASPVAKMVLVMEFMKAILLEDAKAGAMSATLTFRWEDIKSRKS